MPTTPEMSTDPFELFKQHGAEHNLETAAAVDAHFRAHGFQCQDVIEPPLIEQLFVNVKIHVCPPTERRGFVMLYTCGMSDRPQAVPAEFEGCRYSELLMALPPDWPGFYDQMVPIVHGGQSLGSVGLPGEMRAGPTPPEYDWVVGMLHLYAHFPHAVGEWFGPGHLLPRGDPEPLPGTGFTDFVLLPPLTLPRKLEGKDGRHIALHAVVPIYPSELALVRAKGSEELMRRFDARGICELVDPNRPNVGDEGNEPRKHWWPFRRSDKA